MNFKESLKLNINLPMPNESRDSLFLSNLGLTSIPKNINISISGDNKYLNLQLTESNNNPNNHILFQLPLDEKDLSILKNHSDYQDLMNRYYAYVNEYIDEIKNYALQERAYLQQNFPNLIFVIKLRIKSSESYINKINDNILQGKSPYINDIIAERIILSSYDHCQDEKLLQEMCYKVSKALYDFRINTNFRMKKETESNPSNSNEDYITRDYILYPKPNGYKSIHIQIEHKSNSDFKYETQVRTLFMESQSKSSNEIAHNIYKPRLLNDLSVTRVPLYSVITQFNDSFGNPIILDVPFKERFYHFYNTSLNNHDIDESKRTVPITYDNYKKELYEIEKSLGITFKDLRTRIRNSKIQSCNKKEGICL